jgi:isopentenyl phosphate kinase
MTGPVIFLKLGGSLITNKDKPYTVEEGTLKRIAAEIHLFLQDHPGTRLIIGHGSGSFGHTSAARFHTRQGVSSPEEWIGFQQVCFDARSLNQIVLQTFQTAGIPAISFPPSTQVMCDNHEIQTWDVSLIQRSLEHGLIPLIFGDTVLDNSIGGTILSTEDLFIHLTRYIHPKRILLAGVENGVWADYPVRTNLIKIITPVNFPSFKDQILGSVSTDVTGGMTTKIENMLTLVRSFPELKCLVFSGKQEGSIYSALAGNDFGTVIRFK